MQNTPALGGPTKALAKRSSQEAPCTTHALQVFSWPPKGGQVVRCVKPSVEGASCLVAE